MNYFRLMLLLGAFTLTAGFGYVSNTTKSVVSTIMQDEKLPQVKKVLPLNRKNFTFSVNNISFEMIFVEGGEFVMGCTQEQSDCFNNEKPAHKVSLSDFYMAKYPITQKLWYVVMGSSIQQQRSLSERNTLCGEGDDYPMYFINYEECEAFCTKLNKLLSDKLPEGYKFKLPTEAQWEHAARGGRRSNGYRYSGGNGLNNFAWNYDNSNKTTHSVGKKMPNELGIYDMSGNVWEWCSDWYDVNYYGISPLIDPKGPDSGTLRVMRGGAWNEPAARCRVSNRGSSASYRLNRIGFRICLAPE